MTKSWSVLFDLDHTLCDDHRLEETVLYDLAEKCGIGVPSKDQLLAPLHTFRHGRASLPNALREAFVEWGCKALDPEKFAEKFQSDSLRRVPEKVTPVSGVSEMYIALRSGNVAFAIFSNGWRRLQEAKAHAIAFPGSVITSETLGAWKPDPRAFELALARLGFRKEQTLYVGDSPETDVVGAKNAGMSAVWANFEKRIYPEGLRAPDFTVSSLAEIPALVNRLEAGVP